MPLEYPKHTDSFELYYYLGEQRTLKKVAQIRFVQEHNDILPESPEYPTKFESFYTKIKRWAIKEQWTEWIKQKEQEERSSREQEMRERSKGLSEMVKLYQKMVRFALSKAASDVKDGIIRLKNAADIRVFLDLDLRLQEVLSKQPAFLPSIMERVLGEKDRRKVDEIFEHLSTMALRESQNAIEGEVVQATPDDEYLSPMEISEGDRAEEEAEKAEGSDITPNPDEGDR